MNADPLDSRPKAHPNRDGNQGSTHNVALLGLTIKGPLPIILSDQVGLKAVQLPIAEDLDACDKKMQNESALPNSMEPDSQENIA